MKNRENNYKIYIDGASEGNPGPSGVGLLVFDISGHEFGISELVGKATLDQARFKAFMRAIEEMRRRKVPFADIYTSSEDLFRQVKGIYSVVDPILKQLKNVLRKNFSDVRFEIHLVSSGEVKGATILAHKAVEADSSIRGALDASPLKMREESPDKNEPSVIQDIQRSAGGIVYKKEGGSIRICMIAKKGKRIWALPKGRVAQGETSEETAVREVAEETGHRAAIQSKIDEIDYHFYWREENTLYHKFVTFFLMPLQEENAFSRDAEADAVAWFTPGEALKMATYINEKEIIKKAKKIFETMAR